MEKIVKHTLFIFPFLLNNLSLSELADLEEVDQSFEKCVYPPLISENMIQGLYM